MSERTKLLKKAVLTGVGASSNVDRIKMALNEAMDDLVKVGQELFNDLESKGKDKTDSVQHFLKSLQEEATRRTGNLERQVSTKVQASMKKAAKEVGLVTREDLEEVLDRLNSLEEGSSNSSTDEEAKKSRSRKRSS